MKILYASAACSAKRFGEIFAGISTLPGQQVQKYHRLMMRGLARNGADVMALSSPPLTRANAKRLMHRIAPDSEAGVRYRYLPVLRTPMLRHLVTFLCAFAAAFRFMKRNRDAILICDVLNLSVAAGSVFAARMLKRARVGIVTDLPEFVSQEPSRIFAWLAAATINQCDRFILVTESMNPIVNKRNHPYIVVEGLVDSSLACVINDQRSKSYPRVVLYAGSLDKRNGVKQLVLGFLEAQLNEAELWIYGSGDFSHELSAICASEPTVRFFGTVPNDEVVAQQVEAWLLVNPRSPSLPFSAFSFPSKNLESMASGTPLLTGRLPGIPDEYNAYVYLLDDHASSGIAAKLRSVFEDDPANAYRVGADAKRFVLANKSDVAQGTRVLKFLRTTGAAEGGVMT